MKLRKNDFSSGLYGTYPFITTGEQSNKNLQTIFQEKVERA
jgi:hypothetical protein